MTSDSDLQLAPRILVCDDEISLRTVLAAILRREGFRVSSVKHGQEALEVLHNSFAHDEDDFFDLVIADINMPQMDGLTLLDKIKAINPILQSVIVSAYGDMENIRTAMNRGAFDFITKPINFEDLNVTMEKTLRHVIQLKETLKAIKENNILKMYVDETVLNFMGSR